MWSLGVIAFALLMGYMPFKGSDRWMRMWISRGRYDLKPKRWEKLSEPAQRFVTSLLQVDPERRLSAQAALEHEWIVMRRGGDELQLEIDASVVDALRLFGRASTFRRCCMEMMAWSLSHEERLLVSRYFTSLDANKDGIISLGELKDVLESKFQVPSEETIQIFKAMDSNGDEQIHYSDFLAAMVGTRIGLHDHLLKVSFKKFDTDNTGYISATNLREVFVGDVVAHVHNNRMTEILSREVKVDGVKIKTLMKELVSTGSQISYLAYKSFLRLDPGTLSVETEEYDSVTPLLSPRGPQTPKSAILPSCWLRWLPCCTV